MAYEACQKCTTVGQYFKETHRMSYPRINCEKRTDETFRNRSSKQHHREYSIIEELPIDMIDAFVTSDSLHLLHLGIMKKFLKIWMKGKKHFDHKWTSTDVENINKLLGAYNSEMPIDIHRSIRSLNCYCFWKGTEFRTFLLYIGVVLLKQFLRVEEYNHFLKLFCGVVLCSSDVYTQYTHLAKELFDEFVDDYTDLYGADSISSNVHNVSHIVEDVRNFGNLTKFDSYAFENCLYSLKLRVKNCAKPLEQISRRICELDLNYREPLDINELYQDKYFAPELKYPFRCEQTNNMNYQEISLGKDSLLSCRKIGDKWFLTKEGDVIEFNFATKKNEKYFLNGSRIRNLRNFFTYPISSMNINIFVAKNEKDTASYYELEYVKAKMICLSSGNELVFIPLLHTLC